MSRLTSIIGGTGLSSQNKRQRRVILFLGDMSRYKRKNTHIGNKAAKGGDKKKHSEYFTTGLEFDFQGGGKRLFDQL